MSLLETTFLVEDGTGQSDATSYVSVQSAKNYLANVSRPNLDGYSSETDTQIETYLNSAALFMDNSYIFSGSKKETAQALQFPRSVQDEVPLNVKYAAIELSLLIKNNKIYTNPGGSTIGKVIERRVGPITTKFSEAQNSSPDRNSRQVNLLKFVDELLCDFLDQDSVSNNYLRG